MSVDHIVTGLIVLAAVVYLVARWWLNRQRRKAAEATGNVLCAGCPVKDCAAQGRPETAPSGTCPPPEETSRK